MSERGEEAVRAFEAWKASLPKCIGYEGACDGDLEGLEHEQNCPMFGKQFATIKDAFMAGRAEAAAEERRACAEVALTCERERAHQLTTCWPASTEFVQAKLSEAHRIALGIEARGGK